ncbi:hypothetical protein CEXT_51271 [Caerostris extrusa]|uniref:Uncharacterized protein n=1 Tax=Caerostris extrusa TaxID=172846 RepID=A0AAV4W2C3_CAEEX|nr:hypothetical protein CEXT_51271 [Caerostris extrusa]
MIDRHWVQTVIEIHSEEEKSVDNSTLFKVHVLSLRNKGCSRMGFIVIRLKEPVQGQKEKQIKEPPKFRPGSRIFFKKFAPGMLQIPFLRKVKPKEILAITRAPLPFYLHFEILPSLFAFGAGNHE